MDKKSAPGVPDPVATIEAQKDANRITQYTPNGNIQYGTVGADGNFVANTGGDAQMQTESDSYSARMETHDYIDRFGQF